MKIRVLYNVFIGLAILSVLLMVINKQSNYVINEWYISGGYIIKNGIVKLKSIVIE